jgi:FAD synthase
VDVVAGLDRLSGWPGRAFVVVGVFDGLHRGHGYLLRRLVAEARRRAARPLLITFDHHPDEVLTGSAPPLLCDPAERLVRIARAGVAATVIQPFDHALRETRYEQFVAMIRARVELDGFLMTPDAAFGYRRGGTPEALVELGRELGFDVLTIPPLVLGGRPVRSSEVRADIGAGNLEGAALLLGRAHAVAGAAAAPPAWVGEGTGIRFELPVALPPDGQYLVGVEPAWEVGRARGAIRRRRATVTDGQLIVRGPSLSGSVRVSFRARAAEADAGS